MSIGGPVGVTVAADTTVAIAVAIGCDAISVLMMSVRLAVSVCLGGTVREIRADRQIALHVILGRSVGTIRFAEQTVVRILAGNGTPWSFSAWTIN